MALKPWQQKTHLISGAMLPKSRVSQTRDTLSCNECPGDRDSLVKGGIYAFQQTS